MANVDISKQSYQVSKAQFESMIKRVNAFSGTPKVVFLSSTKTGFYVTYVKYVEMKGRWDVFQKANGREPNYIMVNVAQPSKPPAPSSTWVLTGYYAPDKQDTAYTCADSSMQMMLSALGYKATEAYLAKLAGTTTSGTSQAGIEHAVNVVAPKIKQADFYLSEIGWQGMSENIKSNCEFILHIRTGKLSKDYKGNVVWLHDYGHYIFCTGIDLKNKLVRVYDPTKGDRIFTFEQMEAAIKAVVNQRSVLRFCP